jgi:hypothetical protein
MQTRLGHLAAAAYDWPTMGITEETLNMVETAARVIYGILGTIFLALGMTALLVPTVAVPPEAYSSLTAHLVREQAAHAIFLGLMAYWCLWHFTQRRFVHFALLLFAALFSIIHWAEFLSGHRHLLSPILNTLPFVALVATAPLRAQQAP